ncbi:MAG: lasso peptide biosynthesis B2 protein, partial [Proteobacteria bacterium]|nr:lasso peptide biosynthesis B2 protein [Pseudomonadota bacterium]
MIEKFKKNFRTFGDLWLFMRIFGLITLLPVMVKYLSIPILLKTLTPGGKKFGQNLDVDFLIGKIVKYTDYILGYNWLVYKQTCLKRALVLYHFLRKYGIEVQICLGVKKGESIREVDSEKIFQGHAWLLYKGNIFLEKKVDVTKTYRITYSFPDDRASNGYQITPDSQFKTLRADIGPEAELLLLCARSQIVHEETEQIKVLLGKDMDWEYLLGTSLQLGVMPLLYRRLNCTLPEAVPKAFMDELQDYFKANVYRNHFLTDELIKILDLFETHKISVIPYKGPLLAATVYGDLSLRQFSDLDIMVRERDVQTAKDLLLSQRYRPDPKHQLDWEAHYLHEHGMFLVDLHWGISGKNIFKKRDAKFAIDLEGLWERSKPVSFSGRTLIQFSPEDLLMIRCQDAVKEYWKDGWPQLKWICDLAEIIRTHNSMDWERVMEQARNFGNQRLLLLSLYLTRDLLGTALPEIVRQAIKSDSQVNW